MTIDITTIMDYAVSHAMQLGVFETVNGHEPKMRPTTGITCSIWLAGFRPIPERSGLASVSVLVTLTVRAYSSMLAEPQDAIDPALIAALDVLLRAYSGDFEVTAADGSKSGEVDLLGAHGEGLTGTAGYLNIDGKLFRTCEVALPIVIDDLWDEVA